jgi:hypothetical protein
MITIDFSMLPDAETIKLALSEAEGKALENREKDN